MQGYYGGGLKVQFYHSSSLTFEIQNNRSHKRQSSVDPREGITMMMMIIWHDRSKGADPRGRNVLTKEERLSVAFESIPPTKVTQVHSKYISLIMLGRSVHCTAVQRTWSIRSSNTNSVIGISSYWIPVAPNLREVQTKDFVLVRRWLWTLLQYLSMRHQ